ncbi:MAG: metal ABC transporter ATP-binding protein [Phycisphaerales bacterium]|nr:metal ABC transporter ATP-binding protein [Phycisphaerales bacterium]
MSAPAVEPGGAAIEFDRVSHTYEGSAGPTLREITLRVEPGERLGILGPNGAGKTTLVRIALGLLTASGGSVRVFGRTPTEARQARWIGYVPQRSTAEVAFPFSVRQVVGMPAAVGLRPWRRSGPGARRAVEHALMLTGCDGFADMPIGRASGGQLQRALIARALAAEPRLLVLDEPTIGIDAAGQQQFAAMLAHVQDELGVTVVIVTHDLRTIAAGCDRVACLQRTLHAHVSPEGLTPAVLAEVFRHEVEGIFGEVHIDAHRAAECTDPGHEHPADQHGHGGHAGHAHGGGGHDCGCEGHGGGGADAGKGGGRAHG